MEAVKAKGTFSLTQDQVNKLNWHLAELGALLGCLCVATVDIRELGPDFDLEHYVARVQEKFNNFVGDFNEAMGQTIKAQRLLKIRL